MKILKPCESCRKRKLIIRKRTFSSKHAGIITSQSEICRGCSKKIKLALKDELK